ncbi:MAG: WYL domain-containing protein [Acidimicrobiia bacterium]|nr:WYL domain-containing protein [Acidimicrobiia bacterium]
MRADRLVATLLLLQQRGRVTAAEVAAELEVSERTARRDLEALGTAGIPVYSVAGRGGGWHLAGGGRIDLSGLTAAEARALFLVAGPSAPATPEVKAALRKLVRALPEPLRPRAEAASGAVVVDPAGWDRPSGPRPLPPYLEAVQQAVVDGEQLRLGYVARDGAGSTRVVHPLGVAAKGPTWYLVAGTEAGLRTFRVDRITSVEATGEPVVRPDGFDLAEAWRLVVDRVDRLRAPVVARGSVAPEMVGPLRMVLGTRLGIGAAGDDGRVRVELRGHTVRSLAAEVAGFGASLEILDPPALREALAAIGRELAATYP